MNLPSEKLNPPPSEPPSSQQASPRPPTSESNVIPKPMIPTLPIPTNVPSSENPLPALPATQKPLTNREIRMRKAAAAQRQQQQENRIQVCHSVSSTSSAYHFPTNNARENSYFACVPFLCPETPSLRRSQPSLHYAGARRDFNPSG